MLWYSTSGVGRCSWSAVLMSATSLNRFISSGRLKELGEAGSRPVAGAFRCQLQCCHGLPKAAEAQQSKWVMLSSCEPVILEIPLHGVKLGHGVADRGAGGKDNAPAAGDLVHVAALGEHIAGLLGIAWWRGLPHSASWCIKTGSCSCVPRPQTAGPHPAARKLPHRPCGPRLAAFPVGPPGICGSAPAA